MYEILIKISTYIVAILFFTSAIDKVKNFYSAQGKIRAYNLISNKKIINLIISFTVVFELYISAMIITNTISFLGTLLLICMLLSYNYAIFINIRRGNTKISCGCGGMLESENLSKNHLMRNILIGSTVVLDYTTGATLEVSWFQQLMILIISLCFVYMLGSIKELKNQIATIEKIKYKLEV